MWLSTAPSLHPGLAMPACQLSFCCGNSLWMCHVEPRPDQQRVHGKHSLLDMEDDASQVGMRHTIPPVSFSCRTCTFQGLSHSVHRCTCAACHALCAIIWQWSLHVASGTCFCFTMSCSITVHAMLSAVHIAWWSCQNSWMHCRG